MTLPTGIPQTVKLTDRLLEGEGKEEGLDEHSVLVIHDEKEF